MEMVHIVFIADGMWMMVSTEQKNRDLYPNSIAFDNFDDADAFLNS